MVIVVVAILQVAITTPAVSFAYPYVDARLFACIVMCNSTFFPIFLGIPFAMILQDELGCSPYNYEVISKLPSK